MAIYDTLIIDRVKRGTLFDKTTGQVKFTVTQITDPQLQVDGQVVYTTDALGSNIAGFDRQKTAKFSASNTQIDLGLMSAQFGNDKTLATATAKIKSPICEVLTVGAVDSVVNTKITLAQTPSTDSVKFIYRLKPDKSIGSTYGLSATTASATEFAITDKEITLPTPVAPDTVTADDLFAIWYYYDASEAIKISSTAESISMGGLFDLEILLCDYCDPSVKFAGHLMFPSVKFDPSFSLTLNNEGAHAFSFSSLLDNCSNDKEMFHFIIPS